MRHVITIVIGSEGLVRGNLDGAPLWPVGTESTAESTTVDGQARSILDQALARIVKGDFLAAPSAPDTPEGGES